MTLALAGDGVPRLTCYVPAAAGGGVGPGGVVPRGSEAAAVAIAVVLRHVSGLHDQSARIDWCDISVLGVQSGAWCPADQHQSGEPIGQSDDTIAIDCGIVQRLKPTGERSYRSPVRSDFLFAKEHDPIVTLIGMCLGVEFRIFRHVISSQAKLGCCVLDR